MELPVRGDIALALLESIREALGDLDSSRLGDLCAQDLIGLLSSITSEDGRPPSVAQIKFGLDISRRLNVELPVGALQDRATMGRFISRYADLLRTTADDAGDVPPPRKQTSTTKAHIQKRRTGLKKEKL